MHMTTLSERKEIDGFAERAAIHFQNFPNHRSYTDEDIQAGCYFALRYGLGDDCVLVFRLDEEMEPINYQQAIKEV